jgi:hypothetical protein
VPLTESAVLGDYIPGDPDPVTPPPPFGRLVGSYTITERNEGTALARAAAEQFATAGEEHVGPAGADAVRHELIVTHNFLIGWFIRQALDALAQPQPAVLRAHRDLVPDRPARVPGQLNDAVGSQAQAMQAALTSAAALTAARHSSIWDTAGPGLRESAGRAVADCR